MNRLRTVLCILLLALAAPAFAQSTAFDTENMPYRAFDTLPATHILVGGSTILVGYTPGSEFALSKDEINAWVERCARIVASYYGRFPVASYRLLIIQDAGAGVHNGTTYGYRGGATKLHLGRNVQLAQLNKDWVLIHEMIHLALPEVGDRQHWIEEGIAVYVESIARMQANALDLATGWGSLIEGMPKGEPQFGDAGLDNTHTWGRTYWGGAMFALVADVEIRQQTHNRLGLQDALRAIVAAGGTIDHDWTLPQALAIGDKATNTHVLTDLYAQWKDAPVQYDLPALWSQLGIVSNQGAAEPNGANLGGITFVSTAPLAEIRESITKPKQNLIPATILPQTQ
jgi:hypothetical protein